MAYFLDGCDCVQDPKLSGLGIDWAQAGGGAISTAAALDPEPISKTILAVGALAMSLFGGNKAKAARKAAEHSRDSNEQKNQAIIAEHFVLEQMNPSDPSTAAFESWADAQVNNTDAPGCQQCDILQRGLSDLIQQFARAGLTPQFEPFSRLQELGQGIGWTPGTANIVNNEFQQLYNAAAATIPSTPIAAQQAAQSPGTVQDLTASLSPGGAMPGKLTGQVLRFDAQPAQARKGDVVILTWDVSATYIRLITPTINDNKAPSGSLRMDTSTWPDNQTSTISMNIIVDGNMVGTASIPVQIGTAYSVQGSADPITQMLTGGSPRSAPAAQGGFNFWALAIPALLLVGDKLIPKHSRA